MKYIILIIVIFIFIIISFIKSNNKTNKLEKKLLTIKKYLSKGGILENTKKETLKEIENQTSNEIESETLKEIANETLKKIKNQSLKEIENETLNEIESETSKEINNTNIENIKKYNDYNDNFNSKIKYINIKSKMKDNLKNVKNSLYNYTTDIIFDGGTIYEKNINDYKKELDELKEFYEKEEFILKNMIDSSITNPNLNNSSYNNILGRFITDDKQQKNLYNKLPTSKKKYFIKYATQLGLDLNNLENKSDIDKENNSDINKENNSDIDNEDNSNNSIIDTVTTFVKSSIDNLLGTNFSEINNNSINSSDTDKNLNTNKNLNTDEKKYDDMINIYENKINEELKNKGNDINKRDTNLNYNNENYRTNKIYNLNINDIKTSNNLIPNNNNTNNRQIDLNNLYSNNKIISPSENLCSDGLELNKKRYEKYNDLTININNINKKDKQTKILEPYNMDEFEEYSCLDNNCDEYKDIHSRVDCIN